MRRTYDRITAQSLVPLLDVITREMTERAEAVRTLTRKLRILRRDDAPQNAILDLQARLSNHRRELRLSTEELEKLGCYVDEGSPLAVIIPGADGKHEHGYRWDSGALDLIEIDTPELTA
tara:strand:+ start:1400 stop:1759 length:360 start_codon:yes stop_codon:yes gene_type:complete